MRPLLTALAFTACLLPPAWAAHGYALWGELKYPPGFAHFDYVNPAAPKGGELRLVSNLRVSTFDKYNPFTIKGSAPAYLGALMFDTLLTGALDESGSAYGLLAEDVQVAPDGLSATFRLRPQARFHNGNPVLARDVRHSFETLAGPHTLPGYKTLLADVAGVDVLDARTVRFRFRQPNRELPLTVGGLPVFSHQWGQGKPFDQVVMEPPIGSGPYTIGPVKFGKDITYVRQPGYWARDLNVRRGSFNFDRITVRIYRDHTARLEAFKAGEFDLMTVYSAGDWARRMHGKRFATGELVKGEFRHRLPTGFQSYVLNTRRPLLQDARLREALGLAIDYEWMNRRMFYGSYSRVHGLFGHTECAATGTPDDAQLALMAPLRAHIPPAAFGPAYTPPRTDGHENGLRENLRRAQKLLHEAGWRLGEGQVLRNAQGQPLALEYLDSAEAGMRTVGPWIRNLEKIGVRLQFRPVDFALYQQRLQKFDFDIVSIAYGGTHNPGQEYADLFGSQAADVEDSGNLAGVRNPAVDALIARMVAASAQPDFLAACRALERVITHSHYLLPQWYSAAHRMAYNAWRLQKPAATPAYFEGTAWAIETWWARPQTRPSPVAHNPASLPTHDLLPPAAPASEAPPPMPGTPP
ncbi:MAG: extracellular solute-binding protein [Comamonadaceae bacterium]|nr:extracellular solute-binding protein [Comamonadaceae bacterium]